MKTTAHDHLDKNRDIIHAAHEVFREYGVRKVTMDDIAKKLNITRTCLYYYYKDKDDLLKAVFNSELEVYIEKLTESINKVSSAEEKLMALAECYSRLHFRLRNNYKLSPEDIYNHFSLITYMKEETIKLHNKAVIDILSNHEIINKHKDIQYLSNLLNMSMRGIVVSSTDDIQKELSRKLKFLSKIFFQGLVNLPSEN